MDPSIKKILYFGLLFLALAWFYRFVRKKTKEQAKDQDDLVAIASYSSTDWSNDGKMMELVSFLSTHDIHATYEKETGPAGVFNFIVKTSEKQAEQARELLDRHVTEAPPAAS
jgi:hypothetical protein